MLSDELLWQNYLQGDENGLVSLMEQYGNSLRFLAKKRRNPCFCFEDLGQEPESKALIEDLVQTEERDRLLRQCMEELNPNYREPLYLVYFENMR